MIVITEYTPEKRIKRFQRVADDAAADAYLADIIGSRPNAFKAAHPGGGIKALLVDDADPDNKTISISPDPADVAAEALEKVHNKRRGKMADGGYGTSNEQAALWWDTVKAASGTDSARVVEGFMALFNHGQSVKDNNPKP